MQILKGSTIYKFQTKNDRFGIKNNTRDHTKISVLFKAGWSKKIANEIKNSSVQQIEQKFSKHGVNTDFKENNVVAWCCEKVFNIFSQLKQKYKLNIDLPKEIYVQDFSELKVQDDKMIGFCNWFPAYVMKDSQRVFPEQTLFFNAKEDWNSIDSIVELNHKVKFWSSKHFLQPFIHEFAHSMQNGFLLRKYNPKQLLDRVTLITSPDISANYQKKFGNVVSQVSEMATKSQLETIAEDVAKKVSESFGRTSFQVIINPFNQTPYFKNPLTSAFLKLNPEYRQNQELNAVLHKSWHGIQL